VLNIGIASLPGIGPKKSQILKTDAGIETVEDLIYYIPRRYVDRSSFKAIRDCFVNEIVTVSGEIIDIKIAGQRKKFLEVSIDDGTDILKGIFFGGMQYFQKIFSPGDHVLFSGKINFFKYKQIVHPDFDILDYSSGSKGINTGRIVPLYPSTEALKSVGLDSRGFRRIIKNALDIHAHLIRENLSPDIIKRNNLLDLAEALNTIHFPDSFQQAEAARKRLAFNELFFLLFYLSLSKEYIKAHYEGTHYITQRGLSDEFITSLPFTLTGDQLTCIEEIRKDMLSPYPMNRLLQGDVGSGKTVVALAVSLLSVEAQCQVAFMAPTEVLALQHFQTIVKLVPDHVRCALLSGSLSLSEKRALYEKLENGSTDIVIGTHALIQESVAFKNLKLIIIDEQHRFGVHQRALLRRKGNDAHLLIMTATPIPRSLSMTLFGDLDFSSIRTKPANRIPIKTLAFPESRLPSVYNSLKKYMDQSRQIYYVLPLIEESEKIDLKSAQEVFNLLSQKIFPEKTITLLHGKMKSAEKERIMSSFREGDIDLLVSTTVIEVGIDVPNASVMVIEHAERFGLSQLHQLRGRVGRGDHQSFCVLVYPDDVPVESKKRIDIMVETDDGFIIAEEDLKLRGAGHLTGMKQHGHDADFEFTDLINDMEIITHARAEVQREMQNIQDVDKTLNAIKQNSYERILDGIRKKRILEILS